MIEPIISISLSLGGMVLKICPKGIKKWRELRLKRKYTIDIDKITQEKIEQITKDFLRNKNLIEYVSLTCLSMRQIKQSDNIDLTLWKESFHEKNEILKYAMKFLFSSSYKGFLINALGRKKFYKILENTIVKIGGKNKIEKIGNGVKVEVSTTIRKGREVFVKIDVVQRNEAGMKELKAGMAEISWLTQDELVNSFYPSLLQCVGISGLGKNPIPFECADSMLHHTNWRIYPG